jgi:hypothetical protein
MPTLAQVKNAVEAKLNGLAVHIRQRQAAYQGAHNGRFWQGIPTTDREALPNNATGPGPVLEVAPDTTRRPHDQPESWDGHGFALGPWLPMALQIDVYRAPEGDGFLVVSYAKHDGTVYWMGRSEGPVDRSFPWESAP